MSCSAKALAAACPLLAPVWLMSTKALHHAVWALRTSASVMAWLATTVAEAALDNATKAKEALVMLRDFMWSFRSWRFEKLTSRPSEFIQRSFAITSKLNEFNLNNKLLFIDHHINER
jgi:hypothetical protein